MTRYLVALFFSMFFLVGHVGAQTTALYPYEAVRYMPAQEIQNFNTFAEAEAWIKQEPSNPIGNQYLEIATTNTFGISSEGTIYSYNVKLREPKMYLGSWYGILDGTAGKYRTCNGGTIPYLSGFVEFDCPSEAEAKAAFLASYNDPATDVQWVGSYASEPYSEWAMASNSAPANSIVAVYSNSLGNGGTRAAQVLRNGVPLFPYNNSVQKLDLYQCDALFLATAFTGTYTDGKKPKWKKVCYNNSRAEITHRARQAAPFCDVSKLSTKVGNPCVTEFGNKEYREKDFDWEGIAFTRSYNSVADLVLYSGMGNNWAHSFSDRLILGSVVRWIRSDGYYENFQSVDSVTYKSTTSSGLMLFKESDAVALTHGRWRVANGSSKQLWFGDDGRLKRIENGSQAFTLTYCSILETSQNVCPSTDMLTKVISNSGRSLDFEYVTVNVPTGTGTNTIPQPRLLRIKTANTTLAEYAYDNKARQTHVSFAGLAAGEGREYLYAEVNNLCRNGAGALISGCNTVNYPTYLTGVIDEKGVRFANYTYDDNERVTSSEHAGATDRVTLNYLSNGNVQVTLPVGATKVFQYNTSPLRKPLNISLTNSTDGTTQTTTATYSGDRISNLIEPNGARTNFTYDTYRRISRTEGLTSTGLQAPQSRTHQTDWHATLNLPTERRLYNSSVSTPGVLEARTTYTYNTRGQATAMCQIDPSNTTAMAYVCGSATNAPTGVRQSTMVYCEQAGVTAGTCPIVGLLLSSDGARTDVSDITSYSYYQSDASTCATAPTTCAYRKGDLWKVTNALSQVMETTAYDGAGRALQMKDANNVITDMLYHPRGWLTHRKVRGTDNASEADDAITKMDYDATGQVIKVTQPDGDFINFTYDAAHRLTAISDALNNSMSYTLDNAGNRTAETTKDPSNVIKRSLSRVYDTLGRLQTSKNAASTTLATLTYDANDNLNTSTDGLSRVTDQDVDPLNRLIKTIADQGVGKINATTQFEYDARDNLTKVIDPKALNTVYTYNGLNDLTALVSPDTGSTTYTYDNAGNRKTQTDARNVTSSYSYDSANRLTQVSLPTTTQNVSFAYDTTQTDCQVNETFTLGRLARITDESGSTRYCYNRLGQSVRKVQSVTGGPNLTLGSTYNSANRMIAMTYPSGAIVTYLRNAKGQVTGIDSKPTATAAQVSLVSNATYLPFGPLNTLTFGNTRVLTKAYDQNYDIDKVSDSATDGLSEDSAVDVMGNITAITERTTGTATAGRQFAYDNLDRLLSLKNGATNVQSFTYDATGNRLSKTLATTLTTSTYPSTNHRLSSDGTNARTYDANGNTATLAAKSFVYDNRNRLRDYINSGTTVTRTYRYNGKGERVSKVVSSTSTSNRYYFYDEAGHLLGEYDKNGVRIQEYVWLDDQLIAVLSDHDTSTYQFVETDHLGTPRAVIHPTQNKIIWRWNLTNTAFGEHAATADPDANTISYTFNLRYPGQMYDSESTLYYNYFRDYEAATGRYVQSDPIGLKGGISTYGYVRGKPLILTDRLGLTDSLCGGGYTAVPAPDAGQGVYRCIKDPNSNPNDKVCATAECAAGLKPVKPLTCLQKCSLLLGLICGPFSTWANSGGDPMEWGMTYAGCRAAVIGGCSAQCEKDKCEVPKK
jgi:RHS repeat-associated protein